jgi:O-antigen/teichoic acid export membrane protein
MLVMAKYGFGVWTLIIGTIIQRSLNVIFTFSVSKWKPSLHFQMAEAKPLLKFGINIAGSRSLFYLFQKADQFIVGKMFNAQYLGYYSFALQLASIPVDKIVSLVNQISFPVFSRYQYDSAKSQDIYLKTTKYIAFIVAPLFFGGLFLGDELITTLLGEKWKSIIFIFKIFCISQFIVSITVINTVIHNAQGRPHWTLRFHLVNTLLMPFSIFIAAKFGFNALAIPWISVYPAVCIYWIVITLRKLNIPILTYLKYLSSPFLATCLMIIGVILFKLFLAKFHLMVNLKMILIQEIAIGIILYLLYLFFFEKKSLNEIWSLRKS